MNSWIRPLGALSRSALLCSSWLWAQPTAAAEIEVEALSPDGAGFNDTAAPDPNATAGGNPGRTLGEQRRLAFEFATDLWGALLDSPVPIRVTARMEALECDDSGAVLGAASASALFWDPERELWLPGALADALFAEDLDPGFPDIEADFNADLDAGCFSGSRWYYGLDGNVPGDDVDFLSTVLHELAHGLGFMSFADYASGTFPYGGADVFSSLVFDNAIGRPWSELEPDEMVASALSPRQLVWSGQTVTQVAPTVLAPGSPSLSLTPEVEGFNGAFNETNVGTTASGGLVEGALVVVDDACDLGSGVSDAVLLLSYAGCGELEQAAQAGARLVLLSSGVYDLPPGDLNLDAGEALPIPVLHVSAGDAEALTRASAQTQLWVQFGTDPNRRVGSDDNGRVLLNATDPSWEGSSISHWDPLTRRTLEVSHPGRDLLMEPAGISAGALLDLTVALMQDLGWSAQLCGDGNVTAAESCDDGLENSDILPDACRTDCAPARCGDQTLDTDEACDEGPRNGTLASECLSDCELRVCGDGRREGPETCDEGELNSDVTPGACRSDCQAARCGDGVVDPNEICEPGPDDSECRTDCVYPACGDSILDPGEACDDGEANSDETPDACRSDCERPRCGDGVRDDGEGCDDANDAEGDGCTPDCEAEPLPPTGGQEAPSHPADAATPPAEPAPRDAAAGLDAAETDPSDVAVPSTPQRDAGSVAPVPHPEAGGAADASANPQRTPSRESGCACELGGGAGAGWHWLACIALALVTWARRQRATAVSRRGRSLAFEFLGPTGNPPPPTVSGAKL